MKARYLFYVIAFLYAPLCYGQVPYTPPYQNPFPNHGMYNHRNNFNNVTPRTRIEKASDKFWFTITMKDSSLVTLPGKIDEYKGIYFLSVNEPTVSRAVKPSETLSIKRQVSANEMMYGIPLDSCWAFKVVAGKINLYSVLAQDNARFIRVMQHGDENDLIPFTKENILAITGDDEDVLPLVNSGKLVAAVRKYNKKNLQRSTGQ